MPETVTYNACVQNIHKWSPPPPGVVNINVDVATPSHMCATAMVAKDYKRVILNMWNKQIEECKV